jgi:hypothetical protein
MKFLVFIFLIALGVLDAYESDFGSLPVYYEGRVRPLDACAQSWMQEIYNRNRLLPEHRTFFSVPVATPLEFLWALRSSEAGTFPLFWIGEKKVKEVLHLKNSEERFCYEELRHVFENVLQFNLKVIEQMILSSFVKFSQGISLYPGQKLQLRVVGAEIECLFFEHKIVVTSAPALIPWNILRLSFPYPIELKDPPRWIQSLQTLLHHFFQFKDLQFSKSFLSPFSQGQEIESSYAAVLDGSIDVNQFFNAYRAFQKKFPCDYPSYFQLKAENFFIKYPLLRISAALYLLSLLGFILFAKRWFRKAIGSLTRLCNFLNPLASSICSRTFGPGAKLVDLFTRKGFLTPSFENKRLRKQISRGPRVKKVTKSSLKLPWVALIFGFILHSGALFFKTVIFATPPILTLFDSCLFLSWLSVVVGFLFFWIFATRIPIIAALVFIQAIFVFLGALHVRDPFELKPMCATSFWLTLPSMMIIMSYCILFLGGILGHFSFVIRRGIDNIVLCLYLGVFLLVIGTLLGTLWTQSTWKFSWKAEEIWTFVCICFYLALFHFTHFKWVHPSVIALGSILGMNLLGFTTFGFKFLQMQNTELGGMIYSIYLCFEVCFLAAFFRKQRIYFLN